mmetsp:Transcript_20418/g.56916  ORF Transcript_20418/g.56916 Transcript_20418/m.56916 type:complete len:80 (+) Transcript_20418:867-1106(+)
MISGDCTERNANYTAEKTPPSSTKEVETLAQKHRVPPPPQICNIERAGGDLEGARKRGFLGLLQVAKHDEIICSLGLVV